MICNIQSIVKDGYTYDAKEESHTFEYYGEVHALYYKLKNRTWIVQPTQNANSLIVHYNTADKATTRHIMHRHKAKEGITAINKAREILENAMKCFKYIIDT